MEFDNKQFNPNDSDGIIDMSTFFSDTPSEVINLDQELPPVITEDIQEIIPPVNTPTEEEVVPQVDTTKDSSYKAFTRKKIESGEWAAIEGFEDMEIDEDIFDEIQKLQLQDKLEQERQDSIKTTALSPLMLKAIEIEKNGGDVSQVFETYNNLYNNPSNPISNLNLEDPKDQEKLLIYYHKSRGLEDSEISAILEGNKKTLSLDTAALKAKESIDTAFNSYLDKQVAQVEEQKKAQEQAVKDYRKSVSEEAKKYQISDSYQKSIIDKLSKQDENKRYAVDALYDQWRRDPEKAVKLAMFMSNEEDYVKHKASKVIQASEDKTFRILKLAGNRNAGAPIDYNSSRRTKEDVVDINNL